MHITQNALIVLKRRYLQKKGNKQETPEEMFARVATFIAKAEDKLSAKDKKKLIESYTDMMYRLEFLPNTPTLVNAGTNNGCAFAACYVIPMPDSLEGIFDQVKKAALIQKAGGGVGVNWSDIRPRGAIIRTTGHNTRGPMQFIKIYADAMAVVDQGGVRPSANMAIMSVHHPDVLEFINLKMNGDIPNVNISVAVTDEFMAAKEKGEKYKLYFPINGGKEVGEADAREIWNKIVHMAWRIGDPGIVWIDRANKDNPTPSQGRLESTNPCGETWLLPYESCVLGSINLVAMLKRKIDEKGAVNYEWDLEKIDRIVPLAVRFLDSIIDTSPQPIEEIKKVTAHNRKIGLGVMGFADALIKMKIPYNSISGLEQAEFIMKYVNAKGLEASIKLGEEKGVYLGYEADKSGPPRRNAVVTTIAPTGSIATIASVSSGIEPIFAVAYSRIAFGDKKLDEFHPDLEAALKELNLYNEDLVKSIIEDHRGSIQNINVPEELKKIYVTAMDIDPEWHVRMQAAFQAHTNNSISKTINMRKEVTPDDVDRAYMLSYKLGCKGITVFRDGCKGAQILNVGVAKSTAVVTGNGGHGPRARVECPAGVTYEVPFGYGDALITVNEDDIGLCEVIIKAGRSGTPISAEAEEVGRLVSLLLRSGVSVKYILKQLRGISAGEVAFHKGQTITSLGDAVAYAMDDYIKRKERKGAVQYKGKDVDVGQLSYKTNCPDCGGLVIHASKCIECPSCGWSRCK